MQPEEINQLIKESGVDANSISDGYYTFSELYEHRMSLFIALAWHYATHPKMAGLIWKSTRHSDGSIWDGWFILGMFKESGKQITYHLPYRLWKICSFAESLQISPPFDGHTSADVLKRLSQL